MSNRTYDNRSLTANEKDALRMLHQKFFTGKNLGRQISLLYAWSAQYSYNNRTRDGYLWLGRFQASLMDIIGTCRSHGIRNTKLFEALVTGDIEILHTLFKGVHFKEDHGLMSFPGFRTRVPQKGFSINSASDKNSRVISEQVFFVFDPLLDLAMDNFNPNLKLPNFPK